MSVFRFRAHRAATCAFALLAGALLLAGCDSDGPDPPMLERRTPAGSQTGTFAVTNLVEIALTDPDTGAQQTYERIVRAGERNAFSLNWTR